MSFATVRRAVVIAGALQLVVLCAAAPSGARAARGACESLGQSGCLMPFPSDAYTVADRSTATGRRVAIPASGMPANAKGRRIRVAEWNRADGFSPGASILVKVPGLSTPAALQRSRLTPVTDLARYTEAAAGAVVVDAKTGRRWPIWAELDVQAKRAADRDLVIRPSKNFLEGHRYIVALRNLRDARGRLLPAPRAFRTYRDGRRTGRAALERRRPAMERIFSTLRRAGIARSGLYLAWDFTVASERSLSGRALAIRDDAFRTLGDTNLADGRPDGRAPAFAITKVTDFAPCVAGTCADGQDDELARQVEGTYEVPCYLDRPGCPPGATFALDARGLPKRSPGNVQTARFVCNIPRAAVVDGVGRPVLPSLYGHGLFGDIGEARRSKNVHQLGNENGVLVCATDFSGMADEDVPSGAAALQDMSLFPAIADRLQQGYVSMDFLARLLRVPTGLAASEAFRIGGQSVVDTSSVVYYGNSQGGILGGSFTALAPDVVRSVLYVPAMNYSTLLDRSVDFDEPGTTGDFAGLLALGYPKPGERLLVLALAQMLWDRGEPNGYAQHMTSDPLANTPKHDVLIEMAFGDHQVANVAAETEARTIGARMRRPGLDPGRSTDRTAHWGIPAIGSLPANGPGFVVWDIGPIRTVAGRTLGTNPPPTTNVPPRDGQDPHDYVIENSPALRRQIAEFLRPNGRIVEVCGTAPCRTPDWAGPGG